jgi:transcriptional regulator
MTSMSTASSSRGDVPMWTLFEQVTDDDIADLIRDFPLAWVIARDASAEHAALLPLIAERDSAGRVVRLVGHMAKRNPLHLALTANGAALILFQGPQDYIAPAYVSEQNWGPTWNYAQVRIEAEVRFNPEGGDAALAALINAVERDRPEPWTITKLGSRYRSMEQQIIAFDAEVRAVRPRFKLGQDERADVLADILRNHPNQALVAWMRRFALRRAKPS